MHEPPPDITLVSGAHRLRLRPAAGVALVEWQWDGRSLLRPVAPEEEATTEPRRLGCYSLVPYSNRIAAGRFKFEGREYRLALNAPPGPHSIHGVGWQRPWRQSGPAVADSVTLVLDHRPDADWPFAFQATQGIALDSAGLSVTFTLENRHDGPAPAGLGLHPYFPLSPGTRLQFQAAAVWTNRADYLPGERIAIPNDWSFATPRCPASVALDHCFVGWTGQAAIRDPDRGLSLILEASKEFSCLVVFTPPGRPWFCVEPVSHRIDAVNAPGDGEGAMTVLAPGETLRGTIRVRVEAGA